MKSILFFSIILGTLIKSIGVFGQVNTDSLKLETFSIKEILREDARASYLSDEFIRSSKADSTIIEVYFKNEKLISCNKKSVYFINTSQFTFIKREVFTYKGKKILKMIYVKE
jgi:hypothetical protein